MKGVQLSARMEKAFDAIVDGLDGPMLVVTATSDLERAGCLVGFHTQCSIDPPRWLVCISKANRTAQVISRAEVLVVHVLRDDQFELAELFGGETSDDVDKFDRCAWRPGPAGAPVIEGCDWIAGRIGDRFDLGDHVGYLLHVIDAGHEHPDAPQLGLQRAETIDPGHSA